MGYVHCKIGYAKPEICSMHFRKTRSGIIALRFMAKEECVCVMILYTGHLNTVYYHFTGLF